MSAPKKESLSISNYSNIARGIQPSKLSFSPAGSIALIQSNRFIIPTKNKKIISNLEHNTSLSQTV
jgi:hypothetical protein